MIAALYSDERYLKKPVLLFASVLVGGRFKLKL